VSTPPPLDWPLIGRTHQLEFARTLLDEESPGLVLAGAAGVGKTRLAREIAATPGAAATASAWIQATSSAATIPLGAFAPLLPPTRGTDGSIDLMRAGLNAVRDRAGRGKLLLAVDDAHLLDPASAALVLQGATTGAAFVLATVRSGEPCPDAITSLWKDCGATRLELTTLSELQTAELAEAIADGPIEQSAQRWIFETSGGNALYARELLLGALAGGALDQVSGLWRMRSHPTLSTSLSELIAVRMTGLSEAERDVLELLAISGPVALAELEALVSNEALVAVEARGLIAVRGAEVSLAHPLYGEVLRDSIPTLRSRAINARLAASFASRPAPQPHDSLRVARFLTRAGEQVPVPLLLEGARAANLSGDPVLGADLAQRAVDSGAGIEAALLLARAHTLEARYEDAWAVLSAAESLVDGHEHALDLIEQELDVLQWGLDHPKARDQILARAETWWPDPEWQARLAPLRLRIFSGGDPLTASTEMSAALADESVDAEDRRRAETMKVVALFYGGQAREAATLAAQIRPKLPLTDQTEQIAFAIWTSIALETGEGWIELQSWAKSSFADGIRLGDRVGAGGAALALAGLGVAEGCFGDARRWLAEAELHFEHHDTLGLLVITKAVQVSAAAYALDHDGVTEALDRYHATIAGRESFPNLLPYMAHCEAWAAYANGEIDRAQQTLLEGAERSAAMPILAARLTYDAMRAGAPARVIAPRIEPLAERCDSHLTAVYMNHVAARKADDAAALVQVADEMEAIGALRYASEAAADAASAFARAGRQDSARRAAAASHALHDQGQGGRQPSIEGVDPGAVSLTTREKQLIDLARRGLSNAQIAERLVLSIRTVESHLYRAMNKLGISDRQQL
jgi:DNA-binding CsgD family transcriptional regulator